MTVGILGAADCRRYDSDSNDQSSYDTFASMLAAFADFAVTAFSIEYGKAGNAIASPAFYRRDS